MKVLVPIYLMATLFISSCALHRPDDNLDRNIANEIEAPLDAEKLFTIYSTSNIVKNDLSELTGQYLWHFLYGEVLTSIPYKIVDDPKMPTDEAFKIIPTIEGQQFVLVIKRSMTAKFDADANAELIKFLGVMLEQKLSNTYSLYEIYFNAQAKDFKSLMALAKMRNIAAQRATFSDRQIVDAPLQGFEEKEIYWADIMSQFESQNKQYNKLKKIKTQERKAVMDVLDKVSDDQQFRTLVSKNDRKGAAKLLRSYLPWEEMPPFEKLFWETNLKVMSDPLPLEKRILIYRGLDDDVIQKGQLAGKVLTEEEAFKEQKLFLMSTMMTKNQGTWNRRLRSLTSMYDKFMVIDKEESNEFTSAARISTMLKKHSLNPLGSPFLSYTPSPWTARRFGQKKVSAFFLDPRLISFNFSSEFKNELEFLLPITAFPDDLAGAYSVHVHGQADHLEVIKNAAIEKLEKAIGVGKGKAAYEKIVQNSEAYFRPVIKAQGMVDQNSTTMLKSILGKTSKEAVEALDGNQNLQCMDLIQLFWK